MIAIQILLIPCLVLIMLSAVFVIAAQGATSSRRSIQNDQSADRLAHTEPAQKSTPISPVNAVIE